MIKNQPAQKPKQENVWIFRAVKFVLFVVGLKYAFKLHVEVMYLLISGFVLIFTNLGTRDKNTLSAYSVFNKNFEKLPGTFDEHIPGIRTTVHKNERPRQVPRNEREKEDEIELFFAKTSKYANFPCFCDSGVKFKKCCIDKKKDCLKKNKQNL